MVRAEGVEVGKGSSSGEVRVALAQASGGPPGFLALGPPHHLLLSFLRLLIFSGLPEAITAVNGRQPAGWHLHKRPGDRLPAWRWQRRRSERVEKAIGLCTYYGQEVGTETWWGKETGEGKSQWEGSGKG